MSVLRLSQSTLGENKHRVEIRFENEAPIPVEFTFEVSQKDYQDIRWYLEDFLQYPFDPGPTLALGIEKQMRQMGVKLFEQIFASRSAIQLWGRLKAAGLGNVRVEIITSVQDAVAIPWELLRDPDTDTPLALEAQAFVRAPVNPARLPTVLNAQPDKVRILLVICRPGGKNDVPFRSVAGKLVRGLDEAARERFELDVLRPPTFASLSETLRAAKAAGKPYHIVHFDGHGAYLKIKDAKVAVGRLSGQMPLIFHGAEDGANGYLLFENPLEEQNIELVDGTSLGRLLNECGTPILVLNACRSAHADPKRTPRETSPDDDHEVVRAYGSLAQEVMDAGVAGVVAMRYNVYVVTAAKFVASLYNALANGQPLGDAVARGRKHLADDPQRAIAFDPLPLQDWSVPVVYEAAPMALFRPRAASGELRLNLADTWKSDPESGLPLEPDTGFLGRDETLLALDRAFDPSPHTGQTQNVLLLHAFAGQGKTVTVGEFARWYKATGGMTMEGAQGLAPLHAPILFTSFEQYRPLPRVLDTVGQVFAPLLERNNQHWQAMNDLERADLTLQIFQQIPVLWIWDNVEPVAGFPAGSDSPWSQSEQTELVNFLRKTRGTQAKFLLTSRRDEQGWLGNLPTRITLPPMPMQERVLLARALAERHNRRLGEVEDWQPLLAFTQGNPLTITVLVGQALRDGLKTKYQIDQFVQELRRGAARFDDEASQGRSKSLGASLSYGFERTFSEDERRVLALLSLFQGFVDVDVLRWMTANEDWGVGPKDFTRETGIVLLNKAAEIGLLTAHGGGYYAIHPALPWFFKTLFDEYYPDAGADTTVHRPSSTVALHAFVESMGELGNYYHHEYGQGNRDVITALRAEEANLLFARGLALKQGWFEAVILTMQGLSSLYDHTGRGAEWRRLVDEIVPEFVGADDLPRPGRDEEQWSMVTQYRVLLARESRNLGEADRLQRLEVDVQRRNAAALLARPPQGLTSNEKNTLRTLAASAGQLGQILRDTENPECVQAITEQYEVNSKIGDTAGAAIAAFNLGHVYTNLPALCNLDEAERWYQLSLELHASGDRLGRGKCLITLGNVAYERFLDAQKATRPAEELTRHLQNAADYYQQALALLPSDAMDDLAATHNQLGIIYRNVGNLEQALEHYNQCILYDELAGNIYGAGQTRRNIAIALADHGRLADALLYARAALRNFEAYQGRAMEMEETTKGLIARIEEARSKE